MAKVSKYIGMPREAFHEIKKQLEVSQKQREGKLIQEEVYKRVTPLSLTEEEKETLTAEGTFEIFNARIEEKNMDAKESAVLNIWNEIGFRDDTMDILGTDDPRMPDIVRVAKLRHYAKFDRNPTEKDPLLVMQIRACENVARENGII